LISFSTHSFSTSVSSWLQCPCLSCTKACIGFQLSNDNEIVNPESWNPLHTKPPRPPSLADLWKRMPFYHCVFHFITIVLMVLVFLSCVYICFDMPRTFCGWISILVYIYIEGFHLDLFVPGNNLLCIEFEK
jgi:hypothetical protein